MAVSERDRAVMRRVGAAKAAAHADAEAAHLALDVGERLRRSWALYLARRVSAPPREDDHSPFYDLARARNFYRP